MDSRRNTSPGILTKMSAFKVQFAAVSIFLGYGISTIYGLNPLRMVLGMVLIGYIPGALLTEVIFHSACLRPFESFILNIITSLLMTTTMALWLNFLGTKLNLVNLCAALSAIISTFIVISLLAPRDKKGVFHDAKNPDMRSNETSPGLDHGAKRQCNCRSNRSCTAVGAKLLNFAPETRLKQFLLCLPLVSLVLIGILISRARNGEEYSEFYLLQNPVSPMQSDQDVMAVYFGIHNHTPLSHQYTLEVFDGRARVAVLSPIYVDEGGTRLIGVNIAGNHSKSRLVANLIVLDEPPKKYTLSFYTPGGGLIQEMKGD